MIYVYIDALCTDIMEKASFKDYLINELDTGVDGAKEILMEIDEYGESVLNFNGEEHVFTI